MATRLHVLQSVGRLIRGRDAAFKDVPATSLADVLKFGVETLFASAESSLEDTDLDAMLGASADGQWIIEPDMDALPEPRAPPSDVPEEHDDMYVFMGEDYKQRKRTDDAAFDALVAEAAAEDEQPDAEGRSRPRVLPGAPDEPPKRKREYTPEELQALQAARVKRARAAAEAKERRQLEAAERREQAAARAAEARQARWQQHGYQSRNAPLPDADADDADEDADAEHVELAFAIGNMSQPTAPAGGPVVLLHVVDGSGRWGRGGVFDALAALSPLVQPAYEAAAAMDDLRLGDAHMVTPELTRFGHARDQPWYVTARRPDGSAVHVALVVAQTRDRHGRVSGIDLAALDEGLRRVAAFAAGVGASLHLARIGHATPQFNWYGTERLLRKRLCQRGVPATVYYFRRHAQPARPARRDSDAAPSQPATADDAAPAALPDVFSGAPPPRALLASRRAQETWFTCMVWATTRHSGCGGSSSRTTATSARASPPPQPTSSRRPASTSSPARSSRPNSSSSASRSSTSRGSTARRSRRSDALGVCAPPAINLPPARRSTHGRRHAEPDALRPQSE